MQQIPFSEARANLAETLRSVEAGTEPAVISRRGAPAAVLMSVTQYRQLSGSAQNFAGRLKDWREQHLPKSSATAAKDPWAKVRDTTPGRDSPW